MKKLRLLALVVPALALAIYDLEYFDLNHWRASFLNYGPWGYDPTVGSGSPGGSWPQPLHNYYVFGAGQWFGAIIEKPAPETLCTFMRNQNSGGSEMYPTLCRYWRQGTRDSLDRIYRYPGDWPPPLSRFPMAPQIPRSDMDIWCCYSDSAPENHVPPGRSLGIDVYQTVHGFSDSLAQDFFYLKYELANCSGESLQHAYFGMMFDADIGAYTDDMIGSIRDRLFQVGPDTIRVKDVGYAYDYDTIENPSSTWESGTPGIVAVMVLSTPDSLGLTAFKKFLVNAEDTLTDAEQYLSLAGYDYGTGAYAPFDTVDTVPGDKAELLATGPYSIAPDSVLTFWYVIIASPCDLAELARRCKDATDIYEERLAGIAEERPSVHARTPNAGPTIVRGILFLPSSLLTPHSALFSLTGRKVMNLHPGTNDVSQLCPGVYFVREEEVRSEQGGTGIRKVVVTR